MYTNAIVRLQSSGIKRNTLPPYNTHEPSVTLTEEVAERTCRETTPPFTRRSDTKASAAIASAGLCCTRTVPPRAQLPPSLPARCYTKTRHCCV